MYTFPHKIRYSTLFILLRKSHNFSPIKKYNIIYYNKHIMFFLKKIFVVFINAKLLTYSYFFLEYYVMNAIDSLEIQRTN